MTPSPSSKPPPALASRMASSEQRILIYATCYNVLDGVVLTIRKIEQELLAAGHHVCILTTDSGSRDYTHMDGTHPNRTVIFLDNAVPIPFLYDPNNPDNSYQLGFALSETVKQRIEQFEPSLVHVTCTDCTCLHLIQYAREREIPLMGTYHSNIPDYMVHYPGIGWLKHVLAAFFRHQYNFLQALYVPTPFVHRHLVDSGKIDRVTNLRIWGRGIDLERFSPKHRSRRFRQRLGFSDNDVVICWVGRLVPEKRPDVFCHVIKTLHQRKIPFRGLVIGKGPCENEVKNLPNTVYAGWMEGEQLSTAYASADIFVFPSSVETFGNVTLEAAASGLPLVVDSGCSGHLVRHGITGFACTEDDLDAYVDSTLCLVVDDARRKAFSQAGRNLSLQFEKGVVCRRMLENYSKVTTEFYCDYGGHHSNRDRVYLNKDNSFEGGNFPRPCVLVLVEYLFVFSFKIMYQVALAMVYVQELLARRHHSTIQVGSHPTQKQTYAVVSKPVSATDAVLRSITEVEESDSEAEHEDVHVETVMWPDDDDTDTTASDDSGSRSDSSSNSVTIQTGECSISHLAAKAFVKIMQVQFRLESRMRHGLAYLFLPSQWNFSNRKRKNSEIDDNFSRRRVSAQKNNDIVSTDVSLDALLSISREERRNLRRIQ